MWVQVPAQSNILPIPYSTSYNSSDHLSGFPASVRSFRNEHGLQLHLRAHSVRGACPVDDHFGPIFLVFHFVDIFLPISYFQVLHSRLVSQNEKNTLLKKI